MIRRIYDDMGEDERRQFRAIVVHGLLILGGVLAFFAVVLLVIFGLVSLAMYSSAQYGGTP